MKLKDWDIEQRPATITVQLDGLEPITIRKEEGLSEAFLQEIIAELSKQKQ